MSDTQGKVLDLTAVQIADESGRRPLDFMGYWTSRGTARG
jgi:hypothetical protein